MGDILKTLPLSLLAVSALLMAGCGDPAERAAEPATSQPATASSSKAAVPLLTSCLSLFGAKPLAQEAVYFIRDVEALDAQNAEKASSIATRLGEVAESAQPELAEPLGTMQSVFEDFVRAHEESDDWSSGESFNTAKDAVGDICTPVILEADAAESQSAPPANARVLTDDEKFLEALRAAHPSMKSTDTAAQLNLGKFFCDVLDKGVANGKVAEAVKLSDDLVTLPSGAAFTHKELVSMRSIGVTTFCPQHLPLVP